MRKYLHLVWNDSVGLVQADILNEQTDMAAEVKAVEIAESQDIEDTCILLRFDGTRLTVLTQD